MLLNCPIRGELRTDEKSKDKITFTEEYQRIQCVKFLLQKGYKKENIKFEETGVKFGNKGRNKIRVDIIVYNKEKKPEIIVEVKRNGKDRDSAIEHQLKPVVLNRKVKYGIYYDGTENALFVGGNFSKEHALHLLPESNFNWEERPLFYTDLQPITNSSNLFAKINDLLHSLGVSKAIRYEELFKILIAKYYDEKSKEKDDTPLEFQITKETYSKITELYKKAQNYYSIKYLSSSLIRIKKEKLLTLIKLLQGYSFIQSSQDIIQTFFMNFAPNILKKELAQFYTPTEIVNFIASIIKITQMSKIIDPSCGSADFLVGCLKQANKNDINISENLFCWDVSDEAVDVAKLNMILNGDGRTQIENVDSIKEDKKMNNEFDFVITNPPFGKRIIYEGKEEDIKNYHFFKKHSNKELGILFLERNINLLKEDGILIIVLPNGYLTNSTEKKIRKYLLKKCQIVASISLPEGAFKGSGTGVKTQILIVKKTEHVKNYKIFTANIKNIGFDYKNKKLPKIYKKNNIDGAFLLDKDNKKLPKNDLLKTVKQFKHFIFDNNISGFLSEKNNEKYNFTTRREIENDLNLTLCPKRYEKKYLDSLKNNEKLYSISKLSNAEITNSTSLEKEKSKVYSYLDISNIGEGIYSLENKLYGWQLPNRAKQTVKKFDILISKLEGSLESFCMILEDNADNIVATNGVFKITILDELERISFYHFLYTNNYIAQMKALATGSIMLDINEKDLKEKLMFPLLEKKEFNKMKAIITSQIQLHNLKNFIRKKEG